jgi:hypothetical protein
MYQDYLLLRALKLRFLPSTFCQFEIQLRNVDFLVQIGKLFSLSNFVLKILTWA